MKPSAVLVRNKNILHWQKHWICKEKKTAVDLPNLFYSYSSLEPAWATVTASAHPKTLLCNEWETTVNLPSDASKASEELSGTGYHIMRTSLIHRFDFETFVCRYNLPKRACKSASLGGAQRYMVSELA